MALVLPSFRAAAHGPEGARAAAAAARRGKAFVLQQRGAAGLAAATAADGALADRWAGAQQAFPVALRAGEELAVAVATAHAPWYDERMRGDAYTRATQLTHLATVGGLRWGVHPSAYTVSAGSGAASSASEAWATAQRAADAANLSLFKQSLAAARSKDKKRRYFPVVSSLTEC